MRPFIKYFYSSFLLTLSNTSFKSLSFINHYNLASRHSKQPHQLRQIKHWHILSTDSMIKDLELIYDTNSIQGDQRFDKMIIEHDQTLNSSKKQIVEKLEQFKIILSSNKVELEKLLAEIALSVQNILQSLDNVIISISKFCQKSSSMSLHELHAKSNILSYISKQLFNNNNKQQKQTLFYKLTYILEIEIRLKSSLIFLDIHTPPECNITNSHPQLFPQVWKHIQIESYDSLEINKNYKEIEKTIHASIGAIEKSQKSKNKLMKSLSFGYYFPINYVKYELGLLNSLNLYRTGDLESYKKFLNLYEQGFIKLFTTYYFPKITTDKLIYIPTQEKEITDDLDIFKQNKDFISVRVLYHKDLPIIKKKQNNVEDEIEDIIVHMHGGGFVGLSSHTTQNYTRPWANQLKMPVFSIDYRMPPTHPYPYAPNDCLQVYKFLVNHIHKYMRIRPKNIYICGDSAGGNLSCALTALVMKNNLLRPKGLFLAYPSLDSRLVYYPSRKFLINDPLLWPSAAILFFNAYATQEEKSHPIASPILLSQQFIGGAKGDKRFPLAWPITYITIGSKDFLRDECLLFMQKMVESNIPCKCFLFEHLRHAFFSTQKIMKQSKQAFQHSIIAFKQMVERSKKEYL